ncbi:hypothetical protein EMCRGX_G011459 [Ephydatia muelleri]
MVRWDASLDMGVRASLPKLSYVFLANGMRDQPNSCMASESIVVELVGLICMGLPYPVGTTCPRWQSRVVLAGSKRINSSTGTEVQRDLPEVSNPSCHIMATCYSLNFKCNPTQVERNH